jgi:hypothetical protein
MRKMFCLFVLTISGISRAGVGDIQSNLPAEVPDSVRNLVVWPSPETIAAKSVPATATNVQARVLNDERWLRMVLAEDWLPPKFEPVYIRSETKLNDITYYQWIKGNCKFVVAQTAGIFVLQVWPEPGALRDDSKVGLLDSARRLAREILAKTGKRMTGQLQEVPIVELDQKIADFSFDPGQVRDVSIQGVTSFRLLGGAKTAQEKVEERLRMNQPVVAVELPYWFEEIHWFADGQRLILYFLKNEGGPVKWSF